MSGSRKWASRLATSTLLRGRPITMPTTFVTRLKSELAGGGGGIAARIAQGTTSPHTNPVSSSSLLLPFCSTWLVTMWFLFAFVPALPLPVDALPPVLPAMAALPPTASAGSGVPSSGIYAACRGPGAGEAVTRVSSALDDDTAVCASAVATAVPRGTIMHAMVDYYPSAPSRHRIAHREP